MKNTPDILPNAIDELRRIRQHIHQYPELGFDVHKTSDYIADELNKLNLKIKRNIGQTGLVADLKISAAVKTIALRADMDALPIHEQNKCEYRSKIDGKAHMCGHDAHCAMLIVAAQQMVAHQQKLAVNVRFIFQPSEEVLPGGAPAMIKDKALDGVDEIYAIHVLPTIQEGKMQINSSVALAGVDLFEIVFCGKGGHASTPMLAKDPIIMTSEFINQAQTIVSRNSNSFDPIVVSVTAIQAGSAFNVIPNQARLKGAIRYLSSDGESLAKRRLHEIADGIAKMHNASVNIDYICGYPETCNSQQCVTRSVAAAKQIFNIENVIESNIPWMASEDFSYFAKQIPACYAFLGVRNEEKGFKSMVHEPTFDLSNQAMLNGVKYYNQLIYNFCNK